MNHYLMAIFIFLWTINSFAGDHHRCTSDCEPRGSGHDTFYGGNDSSCHWDGDSMHCHVSGGWGPGGSGSYGSHGDHDDGIPGGRSYGLGGLNIPDHPEITGFDICRNPGFAGYSITVNGDVCSPAEVALADAFLGAERLEKVLLKAAKVLGALEAHDISLLVAAISVYRNPKITSGIGSPPGGKERIRIECARETITRTCALPDDIHHCCKDVRIGKEPFPCFPGYPPGIVPPY